MPYKRADSPFYYCRRRHLPGYGDTGRISSGVRAKKVAAEMEHLLETLAERSLADPTWTRLLDAVCRTRAVSLPALLRAKSTRSLEALKRSLHDPLLAEAITVFETTAERKREVRGGLEQLRGYAPAGARLSYLADGQTITRLCERAEADGRKRNSVRRYLLRAISHLLRYHYGNAERGRIFADVDFAPVDDTREIHLRPGEIARLLQACETLGYAELGLVIRLALQTSADRGVLLAGKGAHMMHRGLLVRDVRVYHEPGPPAQERGDTQGSGRFSGTVHLEDSKTATRTRTVPLTDRLARELLVQCQDKTPDVPVFALTYRQLDYAWKRVRKVANLPHIRFKDLRAQVSQYGEEAGVPLTVLARTMGHADEAMTRRYQQRAAVLTDDQAEAIERAMLGNAVASAEAADNAGAASRQRVA